MKLTPWLRLSVAGLVMTAIMTQHQKLFATLLVFAGRSPVCTYDRVLDSISLSKLQTDLTVEVKAASALLQADGPYQLWATPLGSFWVPRRVQVRCYMTLPSRSGGIYNFHGRRARPGDLVLDNGANVGVYTRVALNLGAKKVVAVEPAPENVECLRRNFKNEISDGKVICAKGVWDRDHWLQMHIVPDNSADIEGAERNALRGAAITIAKYHPKMAVSVYHLADDPVVLPGIVAKAWSGYQHECGRCEIGGSRVTPQVFFFY